MHDNASVVFNPRDIKGLLTQVYNDAKIPVLFVGQRCESDDGQIDEYGRSTLPECRDIDPDLFHLLLTNVMGRFSFSFSTPISNVMISSC